MLTYSQDLEKWLNPDFAVPNRKPVGAVEVDGNNDITRGLAACIPFQNGFRDLASGVMPDVTGSPAIITDIKGSYERAVDFGRESNNYYLKYNGILDTSATELTIMAGGHNWFDDNFSLNYINQDSVFVSNRTSGNRGWSYGVGNAGYDKWARAMFVIQNVAEYKPTSAYLNGEEYNVHGCVSKSNDTVRFFENGAFQESKSVGVFTTGEPTLWVGKAGNGGSPYGYEILTFLYVWERALSDEEYIQVSRNPYQLLKPASPITYFIPSAGAGTSLIVQNLTQSQTLSQPALTQHNQLSPANLSQAQTIAQPVITQHHILTPDAMTQAQSLDQPLLTQAHVLTVDAIQQTQSFDQPALTQHHVLSPADLSQAQSLGNVVLTLAGSIDPADMQQGQSLDSPALTQRNQLTPDDIAQSQTLGNVLLTVAGAINPANLSQAQSIEQAAIVQHHVLSVNALLQSQNLGNVTLTPADMLSVADMAQAQLLDNPALTQHHVLAVNDLTQSQILQIVSLGGAVIGRLDGKLVIYSALDGELNIRPALDGKLTIN